jgi:hypothetical protein
MLLAHASVAYDIGFATPFVLLAVIIVGVVLFTRRRGRS